MDFFKKFRKGSSSTPPPPAASTAPPPAPAPRPKRVARAPPPPPPRPTSTDGQPAVWESVDPRNNNCVAYDPLLTAQLESAYQSGAGEFSFNLGRNKFTVKFAGMRQFNEGGGSRAVRRRGPPKPAQPSKPFELRLLREDVESVLRIVAEVDVVVKDIVDHIGDRSHRWSMANIPTKPVVKILDVIIDLFQTQRYRDKYGFDEGSDEHVLHLEFGKQVPGYYANVMSQSIFQRKMLSLAGLRNLILKGPEIFLEMQQTMFSGDLSVYAPKTGPHKMKYFTGNVVDLDTIVLDARKHMNLANQQRPKGSKQFTTVDEFAHSDLAKSMVIEQAKSHIAVFADTLKLSDDDLRCRNLVLDPQADIPTATSNNERGKWPIWYYNNVGVNTYHVNVPTMGDIFGALLLAPYHVAKAFCLLLSRHEGDPKQLSDAFDTFMEEAVSDSCFNGKWKSIEMYLEDIDNVGSIADALNKLQQENQKIFTAEFFENDPTRVKEAAEMKRLVAAAKLTGRDVKTGQPRPIAPEDVVEWMKQQDVAL